MESVEACMDEILAFRLGDALGAREGARRMEGLGHTGQSRGEFEVERGVSDILGNQS